MKRAAIESIQAPGGAPRPGWQTLSKRVVVLGCLLGIVLLSGLYAQRFQSIPDSILDFTSLVAGGYLVGTPQLYDLQANLDLQRRLVETEDSARSFPRLPHVGVLMKPFALIPYRPAALLWGVLMIGCLLLFAWMFPSDSRSINFLALCWSIPAFDALGQLQDSPLVLVYLTLFFIAISKNRLFLAGLLLALCLEKYHLFLAVPVVLLMKKEWRILSGALCGAGILILLAFAVQGWDWPVRNLAIIMRPQIDTFPGIMPNLRGALNSVPYRWPLQIALSVSVVIWAALIARKAQLSVALSAGIIASFLIGHHAYIHDATILLAPILLIAHQVPECRPWAVVLLSPFAAISVGISPMGAAIFVMCVAALLLVLSAEVYERCR